MIPHEAKIEESLIIIQGDKWSLELLKVDISSAILFELASEETISPKLQMLLSSEQFRQFIRKLILSLRIVKGDKKILKEMGLTANGTHMTELALEGVREIATSHGTGSISHFLSWTEEPYIITNFYGDFHSEEETPRLIWGVADAEEILKNMIEIGNELFGVD